MQQGEVCPQDGGLCDLFFLRVPAHGAGLAVAVHRHAAGDGNAEAEFEGTGRLFAGADAIQKILHVSVGGCGGAA